jgi:hypothetical protein
MQREEDIRDPAGATRAVAAIAPATDPVYA